MRSFDSATPTIFRSSERRLLAFAVAFVLLALLATSSPTIQVCSLAHEATAEDAAETPDELVQLVLDLMMESDKDMRALAFEQVRTEAAGRHATQRFAEQLTKLPADGQVGLLRALADRRDPAALSAVQAFISSDNGEVREAAIRALGLIGNTENISALIKFLGSAASGEAAAARRSLVVLAGDDVAKNIVSQMKATTSSIQVALMEILAERRAVDTIPTMLESAIGRDGKVRAAAMTALGQIAGPEQLAGMVRGILAAEKGAERAAAEKAVMFVCEKEANANLRAAPLLEAINTLPDADRLAMLSTLGRVGGDAALRPIQASIVSQRDAEHSAGIAAISNWPNASVAPELLKLIQGDKHENHRITALRALLRISVLTDGRSDVERLQLLKQATALCKRDADVALALQRAPAVRTLQSLQFVLPFVDKKASMENACTAVVELAHHRALREANKTDFFAALDKVLATSKTPETLERAKRYKNNQTWVRPK